MAKAQIDNNPDEEKFNVKVALRVVVIAFVILVYFYLFLVTVFDL
jgi:hypothetical protein